jgi:hypothetical protein
MDRNQKKTWGISKREMPIGTGSLFFDPMSVEDRFRLIMCSLWVLYSILFSTNSHVQHGAGYFMFILVFQSSLCGISIEVVRPQALAIPQCPFALLFAG